MFRRRSCKRLWLVWSGACLLTAGCRSPNFLRGPAGRLSQNEQILVEAGDSAQPSYSPRGDQLVFVSAKRPGHVPPQAYLKDASGVERRLTFSDGIVQHPRFGSREDAIVYASSTDELKDFSPLLLASATKASALKRPASLAAPTEVYVHHLVGDYERVRLTKRLGFDGQARFSADGQTITYTQTTDDRTRVQALNRATGAQRTLQGLGQNPSDYVVAPDRTASAWLDYDAAFSKARLRLRRRKETREVAPERPLAKFDLNFSPDSRWLLWAEFDPAAQAYLPVSLDLETGCVRALPFSERGSRRDPTLSPDGQWLTYTLVGTDRSRIARIPFNPRPGPCPTPP